MNNPKHNQRAEQAPYLPSRSSEQTANARQPQPPYTTRSSRNTRYSDNRSPHEGRDSPSQVVNDETTRGQRINSGSFSQGQNSGSTSPSTTVPARTIYPTSTRPPIGRNSPAPYTGSSSSRNNSITATSPPPASYPANPAPPGNYAQQPNNNKMTKKQPRGKRCQLDVPLSISSLISHYFKGEYHGNEESDQPKQQRNQQQAPSANNQGNNVPLNRPSQLHTQPTKPQQQQQQQQQQQHHSALSSNNVPPPLTLPTQEEHVSSHELMNLNPSDPALHGGNASGYPQQVSHATGIAYVQMMAD